MYHRSLLGFQFGGNEDHFFFIGKKENIIKKGIEGKIHRVHDNEQRANKKKKNRNKKSLNYSIRDN